MTVNEQIVNDVLGQIAIALDIPPHKYKEAMERFDAIRRHLQAHMPLRLWDENKDLGGFIHALDINLSQGDVR